MNSRSPIKSIYDFIKSGDLRFNIFIICSFLLIISGIALSILNNLGIIGRISPTIIGTYEASGKITDISIDGKYAYLTYNLFEADDIEIPLETGLQILDMGLDKNPEPIISHITPLGADCISVQGDFAFIGGRGLQVLDISDREFPEIISSFPLDMEDTCMLTEGNYLYLTGYNRNTGNNNMYIIDINDKKNPYIASSYMLDDSILDIDINDNYAYIANWNNGLIIIDISDKENPVVAGTFEAPITSGVSVYENYAYITGFDFQVIDVADKYNPFPAGSCSLPGTGYDIYCRDNTYAYTINGSDYSEESASAIFNIIDIRDKEAPFTIDSCSMDIPEPEPLKIDISRNYAYTAGSQDIMQIIRIRY